MCEHDELYVLIYKMIYDKNHIDKVDCLLGSFLRVFISKEEKKMKRKMHIYIYIGLTVKKSYFLSVKSYYKLFILKKIYYIFVPNFYFLFHNKKDWG